MARTVWLWSIWIPVLLGLAARAAGQGPSGLEAAAALENVLVEAIAGAEPSVVAIARVRKQVPGESFGFEFRPDPFGRRTMPFVASKPTDPDFVPNEFGTGVVVDRQGLILTAYHVLGEESDYYVTTHDRKVYRAWIKGADPRSDLAVLAVDATDLVPIPFGDAATLRKGQIVIALGNPYAIARDGQVSASWGIVSNLARKAGLVLEESEPTGKSTLHHFGTLIQTDAKLNLGTSGGPLLNLRGQMVGLTTSLAAAVGYEQAAGYAFPVDETFRRVIDTLKRGREVEYGFLGIQPVNLLGQEVLQGMQGIRVHRVVSGTPAHRYGIKTGDLIATVNGKPIHDADGLVLEVGRLPVESTVRLGVLRDERKLDVDVELTKYPVRGKKIVTSPAPAWRGMRIDYPSAVLDAVGQASLGMAFFDDGVIVTDVEKATPTWEAGLRPGMLISQVERTAIRNPRQFRTAVAGKNGAVQLRLADGEDQTSIRTVAPGT